MANKVRCTICGAKNDLVDQCRICATLLPGVDKRRREGTGGTAFHEAVESEREAWKDYNEGRMSAAARSRRPSSLPDAPPKAWGVATGLLDSAPPAAAAAPTPEPPSNRPEVADKVKGSKGPVVFIVVFAVIAAGIGFYLYQQQTDSAATDAKHHLAAALPVLAGPDGRYAQGDVTSFARTNSGASIAGGDFAGCAPLVPFIETHAIAGASAVNTDGTPAGFSINAVELDSEASAQDLFADASAELPACVSAKAVAAASTPAATATATTEPATVSTDGDDAAATDVITTGDAGSTRREVAVMRVGNTVVAMVTTPAAANGAPFDRAVAAATLNDVAAELRTSTP